MSLIVDFPRASSGRPRGVHFAPVDELRYFERNDTDSGKIWYSDDEYQTMRTAIRHAIGEVHARYLALSSSKANHEVSAEVMGSSDTTGIENLLMPKIIKKLKANKVKYVNAALCKQEGRKHLAQAIQSDSPMFPTRTQAGLQSAPKPLAFYSQDRDSVHLPCVHDGCC